MTTFFDGIEDLPEDEAREWAEAGGAIPGEEPDTPDAEFVQPSVRPPRAKRYEKKIKTVLNFVFRQAVATEKGVPDAAAIIMYGPNFAEKMGDLADHDEKVRKAVDFLLEGAENPYLSAALATAPLLLQMYRNHEESLSPSGAVQAIKKSRQAKKEREPRRLRIPFTKRYVEFRWRLSVPAVKNVTNDPQELAAYVFNNPDIIEAMKQAGIETVGGVNLNGNAGQRATSG